MFAFITVFIGLAIGLLAIEAVFRILEHRRGTAVHEGPGGKPIPDKRWGWKPSPGPYRVTSGEFEMTGTVDSLYMNTPAGSIDKESAVQRLFALGDSHTYAYGVSSHEAWPAVLERQLNASTGATHAVYNGAVVGYSMHQYLLRLEDQAGIVRPDYVVVGISYATDLYDLLPPAHGGWVYGMGAERSYFDFDSSGTLVTRHWTPGDDAAGHDGLATTPAARLRRVLWYSATFRYLRRSGVALWVGSRVRIGGKSLWPNMEIVVERETQPANEYQWRLFEALLVRMKFVSEQHGARLIVVGIPYMAQVYDDMWRSTFGRDGRFSRTAATERVRAFCEANGIGYVDVLEPMRRFSDSTGRRVHYAVDGHPTREGQRLIAGAVAASGTLTEDFWKH